MGKKRVVVEDGTYHVMSRIAHREFFLGEAERDRLAEIVWRTAFFCGVEVLAYAMMSNHFHVLVHVPPARPLGSEEVASRYEALKGAASARELRRRWTQWEKAGLGRLVEEELLRLTGRMHSLSKFMQMLKEWYSSDYNSRTGHVGTLWERVFRSVLVERASVPLAAVAGYIDLNGVRAGMAPNPESYRWCSFGEACRSAARPSAAPWRDWKTVRRRYVEMYGVGSWAEARAMHQLTMRNLEEVRRAREGCLRRKGMLADGEHLRIRAFVDGVVVGSRAFVQDMFRIRREIASTSRKSCMGSKISWVKGLYSLREIRDRPRRQGRIAGTPER